MSDVHTDRRSSTRFGRMGRAASWLLVAIIVGSTLAVGSVHTVTLCIVTGALAVAAALSWWRAEPMNVRPVATLLLAVGVGLTAYTALQCVPMPVAWLAAVAPHSADVWSRALSPLHEGGPSWAPISLDPPATRVEALKGVAYVLAFLAALRVARSREGVKFLCNALMASALVVAAAALVNVSLHEDKLFGVYTPHDPVMPRHMAPLLNPNHLAAYVTAGFCVALANGLDRDASPTERTIGVVSAVLLGAMQLWIASRGGVATMVLGALLVLAMVRARRVRLRTTPVVAGLMVATGVAMAVLTLSDEPFGAWAELSGTGTSKFHFFRQAARLLALYPVFGTGRGAFETAFPEVRTGNGYFSVTHPEDVLLQWTTEWGLPVAVVAIVLLVFALRPSVVLARSHAALGAWAALAAVATHNLVDFNSEAPAVTIALAVAAAVVVGGGRVQGARPDRLHAWAEHPRRMAVGLAAVGVLAVAVTAPVIGRELYPERDDVVKQVLGAPVPKEQFHATLRAAMLRHPAEPYFPYAGALRAIRVHDESVMPWVARALERSPVYGGAHVVLAQELRARYPAQSRFEYRTAIEQTQAAHVTVPLAKEAVFIVRSFDDALEVVPEGPERTAVLETLVAAVPERLPATSVRLDALLLQQNASAPEPLRRRARAWLDDLRAGPAAPWCDADRRACAEAGLAAAKRVQEAAPSSCDGYVDEGRIRLLQGEKARAVDVVAAHAGEVVDTAACLGELSYLAAEAGDDTRATIAADRLAHLPCDGPAECSRNLLAVAQFEASRGNKRRALAYYRRVLELDPDNEYLLGVVAQVSMQLGLYGEAVSAYEKLAAKHPGDARYADAMTRARDELLRAKVGLPQLP